ncbi:hypothetical protein JCM3774_001203 [Rhodotorula dairenensis]
MPSNNPFAPAPPSEVSQAAHRFPDVLNQDPDLRHHQQPGLYPPPQPAYGGLAPQQTGGYAPPYQAPPSPVGPPIMAQQQPTATGTGGYYANPQLASLQPQQTGYANSGIYSTSNNSQGGFGHPQQQPYFSDLDPYSSLGASSFASSSSSSQQQPLQQGGSGTLLAVPQTISHPRDYVHENKAALMVWDEYAWKQLFSRLDALREAWETRIDGLKAASNSGADPTNILSLRRDAEDKVDGIHASKMQLDEVKTGWRHSTDVASKARVREALNAGLSSLPSYPAPLSPSQLGGSFIHHAQKEGIMAQYTGYQPPQGGLLQPQQTGYQQQQQQMMTGYGGGGGGGGYSPVPPAPVGGMQPHMMGYGGPGGGGGGGGTPVPTGMGMGMQPQMTGYGTGYGGQPSQPQGGYGGGGPYY